MEQVAVRIKKLSKKYRLFRSPRERLWESLHPFHKKYHREFWALRNINFEVKKGQTVGIIGRNGSGKSTLLRILCSILRPTEGDVITNGSISALLDLNSGFHPEFTGRQNVLMKGMLMGFSEKEMKQRLPAIETFADIGEFIDQPVTVYSSGMAVRLAFACAVHVDPEILIIDEALAVGDAKFQHKCYGKFQEFQNGGKTILLVTHDTAAVVKHCDWAILLERGEILEMGEPKSIVNYYIDLLFSGRIGGYQFSPLLLQENFHGYNLVHYKYNFYALHRSLGPLDLTVASEEVLEEYRREGRCHIAQSPEALRSGLSAEALPDDATPASLLQDISCRSTAQNTELERFLQEIPQKDGCHSRRNYNKNEYRQGYRKAEIIDYLITGGKEYDPTTIRSGDSIDIYIKVRFHDEVAFPLFGFSVKTVDGIPVYGFNTFYCNTLVPQANPSDVIVGRFTAIFSIHGGDYFLDLGVDETLSRQEPSRPIRRDAFHSLDRRCSIVHLYVQERDLFDGYANLAAQFQPAARNGRPLCR